MGNPPADAPKDAEADHADGEDTAPPPRLATVVGDDADAGHAPTIDPDHPTVADRRPSLSVVRDDD